MTAHFRTLRDPNHHHLEIDVFENGNQLLVYDFRIATYSVNTE